MRRPQPLASTALFAALAACGNDEEPAAPQAGAPPAASVPPASVAKEIPVMPTVAKVGEPAPDFRAKDHTGKERTLAEFRGKRLVLWFFPKADTPG